MMLRTIRRSELRGIFYGHGTTDGADPPLPAAATANLDNLTDAQWGRRVHCRGVGVGVACSREPLGQ